jgi:hypothetical protein
MDFALRARFGRANITRNAIFGGVILSATEIASDDSSETFNDVLWRIGDPFVLTPEKGTSMQIAAVKIIPRTEP